MVDIHDGSLTAGMSVLVMMMAAAVDTHLPSITIKEKSCLTFFALLDTFMESINSSGLSVAHSKSRGSSRSEQLKYNPQCRRC